MTPTRQWGVQVAAAAVCGWALGKLAVELAAAGVLAVAQPGGSVRDAEVTAAATAAGIAMLHTGRRHFRH